MRYSLYVEKVVSGIILLEKPEELEIPGANAEEKYNPFIRISKSDIPFEEPVEEGDFLDVEIQTYDSGYKVTVLANNHKKRHNRAMGRGLIEKLRARIKAAKDNPQA